MTLRDWFAGQAMTGMDCVRGGYVAELDRKQAEYIAAWAADAAYRYADAMLKARTSHE